jgi:hypothetical protein
MADFMIGLLVKLASYTYLETLLNRMEYVSKARILCSKLIQPILQIFFLKFHLKYSYFTALLWMSY